MELLPKVYVGNYGHKQMACQYYRLAIPCDQLKKFGYAETWMDMLEFGQESSATALTYSDYDLFWGQTGAETLSTLSEITRLQPRMEDGILQVPPTVIYDMDDNRDYLHPHNPPAYVSGGIRAYPGCELLAPGDKVVSRNYLTGEEEVIWEDKVTHYQGQVFDIARNLNQVLLSHEIMRAVHAVTSPSPILSKYYKEVIGVKNVHTFPNTIVPQEYITYPLIPHKGIRILWQGGCSHQVDWYPLRAAIKEVCQRHPDVTFVIFGDKDEWATQNMPPEMLEYHPWVDYAAYKMKRALLQIDINLCPLVNNPFNICKSAIKWYEASVWDKPEATLAANIPPYSLEMEEGETGLLYSTPEEFVEKLSILIQNAELRQKLGHQSKMWVLNNRTPAQTIPPLWEFYQEVRSARIRKWLEGEGASTSEIKKLAREQGFARS